MSGDASAEEAPPEESSNATRTSPLNRVETQLELLLAQLGGVVPMLANQNRPARTPVAEATPLPQRQLIREFAAEPPEPRTQRVLTPYGPRRGDPSAEHFPPYGRSADASARQAEPPRTPPRSTAAAVAPTTSSSAPEPAPSATAYGHPPTDFTADPTDNETMAGQHRCTRCMNASNHVAPNARLNDNNYKTWRTEMCTIFDASNLLPPLLEDERMSDQRNEAQRRCFTQRLRVAQREIVMALSEELQGRFSSIIERADPILLWRTLAEHFDSHPGVNVVFLKRDMLNRRLQRDERLDTYIKDIDDFKNRLRRANQQLPEAEAVSILLSNTVGVYAEVVNEHEVRLARGEAITWEQAVERLRLAAHARQEMDRQQGRSGRAVQHEIAFVGSRGGSRDRGGGRRSMSSARRNRSNHRGRTRSPSRNSNHRGGNHSPNRSFSPRGRNKRQKSSSREGLAARKAKSKCNACGRQGHWRGDPECPERGSNQDNNDSQPPRSMVAVVMVKSKSAAPTTNCSKSAAVLAVHGSTYAQRASPDMIEWVLDNGAQASVTNDLSLLTELYEDVASELIFGNGSVERADVGTACLRVVNEHTGKEEDRLLEEVSYTKNAPQNLISQTYMQFKGGFKVTHSDDQMIAWLTKDTLKLRFDYERGLYRMWTPRVAKSVLSVNANQAKNSMALLHNRLGHTNMEAIKEMTGKKYKFGFKIQHQSFAPYECVPCIESKTQRMSYKRGPTRTTKKLEKLCVDLCSVGVDTVSKANQFLLVVDEATRFKWGYLLTTKDESTEHIKTLVLKLAAKFPKLSIQMLFSDGGGEFINDELTAFCEGQGIEPRSSNPYSPQENAIVERANQTVMRMVRSMLHATQLPPSLWGEAFLHSIETLNFTPTSALEDKKAPYEALYGRRPNLSKLRTWGCLVHMHIPDDSRQRKEKLSSRTQLCLLIGYSSSTNGYKLLNLRTGSVTTCRGGNMKAHEQYTVDSVYVEKLLLNTYDYGDHQLPEQIPIVPIKTTMQTYLELPKEIAVQRAAQLAELAMVGGGSASVGATAKQTAIEPAAIVSDKRQPTKAMQGEKSSTPVGARKKRQRRRAAEDNDNWEPATASQPVPDSSSAATSRPKRDRKKSIRLKDYVVTNVIDASYDNVPIPTSHKQAARSKKWADWKVAMQAELDSQQQHETWTLVPRTEAKGKRVISCKWVFALKRDAAGRIKRYKARLVIRGFLQRMGIDYNETYAPVIRFETIRCAILFALERDWDILQFDVKTAFLYGDLDEEVYMEQPPGFGEDSSHYICRLKKSLYGLRQAPRVWNQTLHKFLTKVGLERLDSDYGLYARKVGDEVTLLLTVYVDDLLLLGPSDLCAKVAQQLAAEYELTALGPVKYLLGVEILIDRQRRHAIFCQRQYVSEVLKRFHMEECNSVATPEALRTEVVKSSKTESLPPYRELVGALQYLVSASRPDIAHAVRHLSKYLSCFDHTHYAMAKRVLRYLAGTASYGLVMDIQVGNNVELVCYTDADYANDPDDRKSVSGFVTFVNGNVISYGSRKQEINAQSTTEAEYIAMNEGTRDLLWLMGLCEELSWTSATPEIRGDNKSCIYLTAKPGKHSKTKHIQNKFHLVRHLVEEERLRTSHVGTNDMIADIMTKPLPTVKFEHCRDGMKVLRIDRAQQSS